MNEVLPPDPPGGVPGALGTLRHVLADPLSAAGMKLVLLERRLAAGGFDGPYVSEKVRGAKADLAVAGRLIDLLPRLAAILGEAPVPTAMEDLCRAAGVPLEDDAGSKDVGSDSRLLLRRLATSDALRTVVAFLVSLDPGRAGLRARAQSAPGLASLRIEAVGGSGGTDPERLFHPSRGQEPSEDLFLARATVESDGGRLELREENGRLVARLSWPRPAPGEGGTPA